jgi:hypothetical protein
MLKLRLFCICVALMVIGTGILLPVSAGETIPEDETAWFFLIDGGHTQILSTDSPDVAENDLLQSASRLCTVTLSDWVGVPGSVAPGDEVVLNLFPDASYVATIDRVSTNVNGTLSVRGRLQEYPWGYVIVSSTDQEGTLASIEVPEEGLQYLLFYEPRSEEYYLAELDPGKKDVPQEAPPLLAPPPSPEEEREIAAFRESMTASLGPEDPATIDVMIVYTPAAEDWAGAWYAPWRGGINNNIDQAMQKAQLVMDNSNTGVTLELVHSARVEYTEDGNSSEDLDRLRDPNDEHMDEVHQWRDEHGADLVALFALVYDVAGRSWLLNDVNGLPDYGFALTAIQYARNTYTHIHEMGHNMGCHHHPDQTHQEGPTVWVNWPENEWSAGWRWTESWLRHYCTVMTYESGQYFADGRTHTRVPHFSNPDVLYSGHPTGDPIDGDNARTIREIKHVIAAYRQQRGVVAGYVGNAETGWPLSGAGVEVHETGDYAFTDYCGYYEILLPPGSYTLTASYLTFYDKTYYDVQVVEGGLTQRHFSLEPMFPGYPIPLVIPDGSVQVGAL